MPPAPTPPPRPVWRTSSRRGILRLRARHPAARESLLLAPSAVSAPGNRSSTEAAPGQPLAPAGPLTWAKPSIAAPRCRTRASRRWDCRLSVCRRSRVDDARVALADDLAVQPEPVHLPRYDYRMMPCSKLKSTFEHGLRIRLHHAHLHQAAVDGAPPAAAGRRRPAIRFEGVGADLDLTRRETHGEESSE